MRLQELDYDLPHERIAQVPIEPRDAARLLVDRGSLGVAHAHVSDLPELLRPGDVLVVNESRRARPLAVAAPERRGRRVLLLEPADDSPGAEWDALVRPGRRLRDGEELLGAGGEPVVVVGERCGDGSTRRVRLLLDAPTTFERHGELPLPPYIDTAPADPERYQTVYARRPGSAAAPTAGLHLTAGLLDRLRDRGVDVVTVELVVGLDTFAPITEDDPEHHRIHSERYAVPAGTLERCRDAARAVAVGTTAVRALETAAATGELSGRTELYITPGYRWRLVDVLLTNFHLPRTTLLMMIDAFVGERWRRLYATALAEGYRFASFGDAMLLDRAVR